jgi:hypothetical protein
VQNALRWLTVQSRIDRLKSIVEFLAILVERFVKQGQRQVKVLADAIDKKIQNVWAAPVARSLATLKKFEDLIPPFIRQHYEDVARGGQWISGVPPVGVQHCRHCVHLTSGCA